MQLLLQNFICLLRDSHTARTSWSLKKRMEILLLIVVNYIHAVYHIGISSAKIRIFLNIANKNSQNPNISTRSIDPSAMPR